MSRAPDETSRRKRRSPLRAIGVLVLVYLVSRVGALNVLPIFLDEAVHLQWAERLFAEGRILKPVGSGRLLAVAAYGMALPFEERLWVARLIATLAGAATLVFTVLISGRLFGDRAAILAGLLYILSPFALVYDRLALSDGFLTATITGLLLATLLLVENPGDRRARTGFAILLSLAVMSKVSALLFLLAAPLGVLTLSRNPGSAFRSMTLASLAGFVGASPMLWFFASSGGEISAQHLIDPASVSGSVILNTLLDMRGWLLGYFTPPVLAAAVLSAVLLRDSRVLWLATSAGLPFLLFALFSQPWSARYVLPTLPPFLILVAGGIEAVALRTKGHPSWLAAGLLALISTSTLSFDWDLLRDPARAAFPEDDRRQLVTGWPAGYGVSEISARLKQEATLGPVLAWVDTGGTRTVPTSLAVLLGGHPAIKLVEGDFGSAQTRDAMVSAARTRRVLAITGPRSPSFALAPHLAGVLVEPVEVFLRPGGEWAATMFRIVAGAL